MTVRRATDRRTTLEKKHTEVIAALVQGDAPATIAERFGVHRSSVAKFITRHADEIEIATARLRMSVDDYVVASKVERIAGLDRLRDHIEAYIADRGLIERTTTTTEHATIERERFAREVPAELRAVYRAAAEELGQLPRDTANLNVNVTTFSLSFNGGAGPQLAESTEPPLLPPTTDTPTQ